MTRVDPQVRCWVSRDGLGHTGGRNHEVTAFSVCVHDCSDWSTSLACVERFQSPVKHKSLMKYFLNYPSITKVTVFSIRVPSFSM